MLSNDREHYSSLMTSASESCDLSVVVGSTEAAGTLRDCLAALRTTCAGLDTEILVVDASSVDDAAHICAEFSEVRLTRLPPGTLVPLLWGAGLRAARGRVVAFTIGQCVVDQGWARAMLDGIASGAAGVGGRLDLRKGSSATVRATFYLRYSAWLAARQGPAHEIAGDNAAYDHESLRAAQDRLAAGFWEVDVHARFRELGKRLVLHPAATARFGGDFKLRDMAALRFAHGRHSGAFRVAQGIRTRWQMVLGAPLVPGILLARVARRVAAVPAHWPGFLSAIGAFLVLATAWAAGEAMGGLSAPQKMRDALRAA
ncbi:MAG: putative glycosyltransferase [Gemmatimonadetes bacterium]|nr:putative glycosyltransferase [Gemmatimonadota bacterium]